MNSTQFPSWIPAQPSTPGAGGGGPQNFAGVGGGGGAGGIGGLVGGGGYSGEVSEANPNLNQLKSTNKNKLATNLDMSGAAGARGAVFNFGSQANPIVSAAGGSSTIIWIVVGAVVLGLGFIFLRRK